MYNSLIDNLKKILEGKDTADKKLLKIQTLVDFAAGLEQPRWTPQPVQPTQTWYDTTGSTGGPKVTAQKPSAKPAGPGAIVGVEDVK